MLKYKTIVAAVLATAAFAVYAEPPENWDVESGPQPAPYGVVDPVLTPDDLKVAGFQYVGDVESGPQPAPYGIADPVLTPADVKFAVMPQDALTGPQKTN